MVAAARGGAGLVDLFADAADVRPHLGDSGVMVVPLRIGGGSRLKILEALASGLPVVSTQIGAEGLHLENGRDLTVVERMDEMAPALAACIRAPEKARRMAEQGRRLVRGALRLGRIGRQAGSGVGKSSKQPHIV